MARKTYAKTVVISCGKLKALTFYGVTEAKINEELDSDITKTFDEPVNNPSSDGGFTISISALEARNLEDFKNLKKILLCLKKNKGAITISETVKYKDITFKDENHLNGVSLTSNEVSYDAEDLTARDLEFKAETLTEYVDGEEIKID